jgi:hypothetical protein
VYWPTVEGGLDEEEFPESEATLARRVLTGIRDWEFRFEGGFDGGLEGGGINGDGASWVGDIMVIDFPAALARVPCVWVPEKSLLER